MVPPRMKAFGPPFSAGSVSPKDSTNSSYSFAASASSFWSDEHDLLIQ
jgi:hypothetical protein